VSGARPTRGFLARAGNRFVTEILSKPAGRNPFLGAFPALRFYGLRSLLKA
jgi:hypothetical protein